MTKALVMAAVLGLGVTGASACEFMKSAKALDKTTVASIVTEPASEPAMSKPATDTAAGAVKDDASDKEG